MKRWPVMLWLAVLAGCLWWVTAHTRFNTDMAAFLPDSAAPAQQLMVDQLKDGVASRLVLLAVENGSTGQLAAQRPPSGSRGRQLRLIAWHFTKRAAEQSAALFLWRGGLGVISTDAAGCAILRPFK